LIRIHKVYQHWSAIQWFINNGKRDEVSDFLKDKVPLVYP
jgi:hypothetical protein